MKVESQFVLLSGKTERQREEIDIQLVSQRLASRTTLGFGRRFLGAGLLAIRIDAVPRGHQIGRFGDQIGSDDGFIRPIAKMNCRYSLWVRQTD